MDDAFSDSNTQWQVARKMQMFAHALGTHVTTNAMVSDIQLLPSGW
jgi:hypothetical protein